MQIYTILKSRVSFPLPPSPKQREPGFEASIVYIIYLYQIIDLSVHSL